MDQKSTTIDKILHYLTLIVAFLMPVFYLPLTSEFFEFNKLALLTAATLLLVVIWIVKLLLSKKVFTVKSPLNAPLIALAVVFILSTVFSLNPYISIFGKYGRWFPSLFAYVVFAVFYFAVAINVNTPRVVSRIVNALVAGVTVSSIVAILSYFGVYVATGAYAQNPNFNLTGSVTTTAVMAALGVVLALNRLVHTDKVPVKVLWIQTIVVNAILLALYSVFSGWVVLVTGALMTLLTVNMAALKKNSVFLMGTLGAAAAIILVANLPQTRGTIKNERFANEINMSFADSWVVSSSTITDFPLLGSGPGTFSLNFTRYRPLRLNGTDLWNVRFDKPFNELFNVMGTLGIIGVLAMVFLAVRALRFALRAKRYEDETGVMAALSTGVVAMLVLLLVTYATILNMFVLFLFLALLTGLYSLNTKKGDDYVEHVQLSLSSLSSMAIIGGLTEGVETTKRRETFQYFAIVPMILFVAFIAFYSYRTYAAEYYLRKSIEAAIANDGTATYENQRQAINMNPQRSEYRNTYAQTNLLLASNLSQSENLTDQDRSTIQTLIAQAIREARLSTEVINPLSAGSWEVRANVYRSLIGVADNAEQWSLGAYNTAIQLDPTNPRLRLEAGGIYYLNQDYLSAANLFRQATNLKPDYANAHYNLSQALKQLQNYPLAQRELELVLSLIPEGSGDRQRVLDEIEELKGLTAGQAQGNPTVESLDQQAQIQEQGQVTQQESLTQPGNVNTLNNQNQINLNQQGQPNQQQQPAQQQQQPTQ